MNKNEKEKNWRQLRGKTVIPWAKNEVERNGHLWKRWALKVSRQQTWHTHNTQIYEKAEIFFAVFCIVVVLVVNMSFFFLFCANAK